ncbi:MAG: DUF4401 domain-containing protein, partial [Betaproteobacteria bacterium]|nr:DUF4401 domain-containing protein [Betaproteobacteria bacterium]
MKPLTYTDLIAALQNENPDFQPPPTHPTAEVRTPWYLRVMLGFIGILGGCFILGFFGAVLSNLYRNTPSQLILSALLFALASAIYRRWRHSDLADQFALVMSITGQILIAIAFGNLWQSEPALGSLLLALLQIGLIILMPNALHRLLSTLVALLALGYA